MSFHQRRAVHHSLTACADLYNLSTHGVIARSQIISFLFEWKRSFRLLVLRDGNVVGNASCSRRQPQAAQAFWNQK